MRNGIKTGYLSAKFTGKTFFPVKYFESQLKHYSVIFAILISYSTLQCDIYNKYLIYWILYWYMADLLLNVKTWTSCHIMKMLRKAFLTKTWLEYKLIMTSSLPQLLLLFSISSRSDPTTSIGAGLLNSWGDICFINKSSKALFIKFVVEHFTISTQASDWNVWYYSSELMVEPIICVMI